MKSVRRCVLTVMVVEPSAGMVWLSNQVKTSQKPVPPAVRYPRHVRTLLMSVWFRLRERELV